MQNDRKYLLGINVNMVTGAAALEWIIDRISRYEEGQYSRYVTAIDCGTLAAINGWKPSDIRNHEIAAVLQKASLVLCGSQKLQRLGNCIEGPFRECTPINSLVIPLAIAMEHKDYSIFLLCSRESDLKVITATLQQSAPNLKIVGSAVAHINTTGEGLLEAPDRDNLLIEQINHAKPSLLLLNFGFPIEELWFSRVVSRLQVPVTVSMGNQSKENSWKNIPQLLYMSTLATGYHRFSKMMYKVGYRHSANFLLETQTRLFVASTRTIAVLELPTLLDLSAHDVQSKLIDEIFSHDHLVVDFQHVRHITLQGIGFLTTLWQRALSADKAFSGLFLNGDMRLLLRLHRAWNTVGIHQYSTVRELLASRQHAYRNFLYGALEQNELHVTASFFGQLDNSQDYDQLYQQLVPILKERHCTLDLTYCTALESRGCSFLLALQKHLRQQGKRLYIYNADADLKKEFQRTGILPLITLQATHPHHPQKNYKG